MGEQNRIPINIRMNEKVWRSWSRYCNISKGWGYKGELTEEALTEFMVNHPEDACLVEIQRDFSEKIENGIQRELEEKLLCRDIEGCLWTLSNIESTNRGNFSMVFSELVKHVSAAVKIKNPSDRLLSALEKVKESKRLD